MLGVALSLFATTSIGIFMGTMARSMPQLGLLVILVLLPLQMLSGGSTPPRKYAADGAGHYADHADDTLCQPRAGHSLPWCRISKSSGRSS